MALHNTFKPFKKGQPLACPFFAAPQGLKLFYYRGLKEWKSERGYLRDTCLSAQDKFKTWLDYFKVRY